MMRVSKPSFKLASLAVLTVLAACGGGSDAGTPATGPTASGNQSNAGSASNDAAKPGTAGNGAGATTPSGNTDAGNASANNGNAGANGNAPANSGNAGANGNASANSGNAGANSNAGTNGNAGANSNAGTNGNASANNGGNAGANSNASANSGNTGANGNTSANSGNAGSSGNTSANGGNNANGTGTNTGNGSGNAGQAGTGTGNGASSGANATNPSQGNAGSTGGTTGNAGTGNAGTGNADTGNTGTGNMDVTPPVRPVPPVVPPSKPTPPEQPNAGGEAKPPVTADPSQPSRIVVKADNKAKGQWTPTVNWPLVAIHAALTADGRVLSYGTDYTVKQGSKFSYDVWDPTLGTGDDAHMMLPSQTDTFMFCSAQILLQDGRMMILGGDLLKDGRATNRGNKDVNLFDPASGTMSLDQRKMTLPRWYSTATTLPTGEVYIQGGTDGEEHPEIRKADGTFRALDINTQATLTIRGQVHNVFENNYPRNFVAPNGKIFGFDPHFMYEIDPYANGGKGSAKIFGPHWDFPRIMPDGKEDWSYWRAWQATSTAAMVRPGLIFQFGGVNPGGDLAPVTLIDINSGTPKLIDLDPLNKPYVWSNATVMADGNVLVSGGSTKNLLDDLEEPINQDAGEINYDSLIFNPDTRKFSPGARFNEKRLYHSTTLLLPDATILSTGGGQPGPVDNLNAQIFYPPYLFNADGTLAKRPVLQGEGDVAMVADPASTIHIPTADAADISKVTLIKTGATTHSFDMDQRYMEVKYRVNGNGLDIELPANKYLTPPGFYHVFAFNKAGVPSKSRMVRINPSEKAPL